jgi:hypothetical protein
MLRAYLVGARAAAQRWPLILALWLIAAVFGAAFALASGVWLTDALDGSLATRTLFRQLDADVFVDLWYHHREGLRGLVMLGLVLGAVHTILWWWLDAVVVCAVEETSGEEHPSPWRQGLALAPLMAQLFALAIAALGLFTAAVGGTAYVLTRWSRESPSATIWFQIGAVAAALWVFGYVFLMAVHDHARLRVRRSGDGALAAYAWALRFVSGGGERAFALACVLQLSGLALWGAYQAVGWSVPMNAVLDLTGLFLWSEAYLLARLWVRVWFFAAQNELQT